MLFILSLLLVGCSNYNVDSKQHHKNSAEESSSIQSKEEYSSESIEKELTTLEVLNNFAAQSKSVIDVYYTKKIEIGKDKDIVPGIYDLEITGGSGNINVERNSLFVMYVNWIGGADNPDNTYPSKFRIILADKDFLELNGISKFNLIAVSQNVEVKKELTNGEFVVGRDIPSGKYKVKTSADLNTEYPPSWDIAITDLDSREVVNHTLEKNNQDIVIEINDGNILTTFVSNYNHEVNTDDIKIIFEKVN